MFSSVCWVLTGFSDFLTGKLVVEVVACPQCQPATSFIICLRLKQMPEASKRQLLNLDGTSYKTSTPSQCFAGLAASPSALSWPGDVLKGPDDISPLDVGLSHYMQTKTNRLPEHPLQALTQRAANLH